MATQPAPPPIPPMLPQRPPGAMDKDLGRDARSLGGFRPGIIRRTEILIISVGPLPRYRQHHSGPPPLVSFGRRPRLVTYGNPLVSFSRYV